MADHQMRRTATDAPLSRTIAHRLDHLGMVGKPQVIVGTEGPQPLAIDQHFRLLRSFQQRALAVEMLGAACGQARGEIETHESTANRWITASGLSTLRKGWASVGWIGARSRRFIHPPSK